MSIRRRRFAAFLLVSCAVFAAPSTRLLDYGVFAGDSQCACAAPRWVQAIDHVEVQRLLLELAKGALSATTVEGVIQGSGVDVSTLVTLRFIRTTPGGYVLATPLFTSRDTLEVRGVAQKYAKSMAKELMEHRGALESAVERFDPGEQRKAALFIALGCLTLEWDGRSITSRAGYRKESEKREDGSYVPWLEEMSEMNRDRVYCFSSSKRRDDVILASFGDRSPMPRHAFPEVLDNMAVALTVSESSEAAGLEAGKIMFTLRNGPATPQGLSGALGAGLRVENWLNLLQSVGYVRTQQGAIYSTIPVFSASDRRAISRIRTVGNDVMERWLRENYPRLQKELQTVTPARLGIPFDEWFTQVWSWVVGLTNLELVRADLMADPYSQRWGGKGFIPAVIDAAVLEPAGSPWPWLFGGAALTAFAACGVLWWVRGRQTGRQAIQPAEVRASI